MANQAPPPVASSKSYLKTAVILAVVAALFLLGREAGAHVFRFAQWVEGLGTAGILIYIAGYAVATVAFLPGSVLTLAGGAIYGVVRGSLITFTGAVIGASAAFFVSRYFARQAIEKKLENDERFAAIDRAIVEQGRKIVFLLRLSPLFPFNLLNYVLGLTKVSFRDYFIAFAGMIPGTILYVYYGSAAGEVAALASGARPAKGPADYALFGVGLLATLIVTTIVTRIARKALKEATGE